MKKREKVLGFFSQVKKFFHLWAIQLAVLWKDIIEWIWVVQRYYGNAAFRKVDLKLLFGSIFSSPFSTSKRFLEKRGDSDLYVYGETPITTMDQIVQQCRIQEKDTVFELGAGRGRIAFWLNTVIGCQVVAIEQVPDFVEQANALVKQNDLSNIEFRQEDFLKTDFSQATVIYLYGSTMSDDAIQKLVQHLENVPAGTKVISVSFSIIDYAPDGQFELLKRFSAPFPWGKADVYFQVKK